MRLSWKGLAPIGMAMVVVQGGLLFMGRPVSWISTVAELGILVVAATISLLSGKPISGRQLSLVEADELAVGRGRARASVQAR
jgi:hypothetical protein